MIRSVLIVGLMLLVGACYGPQRNASSDTAAISSREDTASDSLQPANEEPAPAPGTARVRAMVQACEQHAPADIRCQLEIREVVAYGAATPVLDAGEMLSVRVPEHVATSSAGRQHLRANAAVEVTLAHHEQPSAEAAPGASWELVTIHAE